LNEGDNHMLLGIVFVVSGVLKTKYLCMKKEAVWAETLETKV
jgi:BRCT domain type II-containing protein